MHVHEHVLDFCFHCSPLTLLCYKGTEYLLAGWKGTSGKHLCFCVWQLDWHEWTRSCRFLGKLRKEKRKEAEPWRKKRGGSSWTNPHCFAFLSLFFFGKNNFFVSRLFSFLIAAMCLISYVICSRPRAGLTLRPQRPSSPYSLTQRLAKGTQLRANEQCKKIKALTQQKTKRNFFAFALPWDLNLFLLVK